MGGIKVHRATALVLAKGQKGLREPVAPSLKVSVFTPWLGIILCYPHTQRQLNVNFISPFNLHLRYFDLGKCGRAVLVS
jgi:hypothetical protein